MRWLAILLAIPILAFPALKKAQINMAGETIWVEVADRERTRAKGLMGRKALEDGYGMLFVYDQPQILSFWMKDTLIPLSVGFFDQEKILFQIVDMNPPEDNGNPPSYQSKAPGKYALEVPQGWFKKNQIVPGMKFSFLDPSDWLE